MKTNNRYMVYLLSALLVGTLTYTKSANSQAAGKASSHSVKAVAGTSGKLASTLKLTPAQKAKRQAIRKETTAQIKAVRASKTLSPQQKLERMRQIRQSARLRATKILTPTQQKKLTQLRQQRDDQRHRQALEKMSQNLKLTSTQKTKILAIWKSAATQTRTVRESTSLTADQKKTKLRTLSATTRARVSQILTPAQRKKREAMRAQNKAGKPTAG